MNDKNCKYCKSIAITIVPPSKEQYCTLHHKYVDIHGDCESYEYDESLPQKYREYGDIE